MNSQIVKWQDYSQANYLDQGSEYIIRKMFTKCLDIFK